MTKDIALEALTDSSFRFLLNKLDVKLTNYCSFRNSLLSKVMDLLFDSIEKRLISAECICLIVDKWTNKNNIYFIGLGACIINSNFEREL